MFATLLGGLPRPSLHDAADGVGVEREVDSERADLIAAAVLAQVEAGLEPITDGRLGDPAWSAVDAYRLASGLTDRAVKQSLPGPYGAGRGPAGMRVRERRMMAAAERLRDQVKALADAGCPLVEIEEAEAHRIEADARERRLFVAAHRRLTDGVTGTHLSLSIVGAAANAAGIETILDSPYASLAVDLLNGPDNWRLVTAMSSDLGVVVGAMGARESGDEAKELLLWGVHYAATNGRGIARVGLGSAGSWANLTWEAAVRKMRRLGEAARLAALPPSEELMRSLRPDAISTRRAALGPDAPPAPRRRRPAPADPPTRG